jgi:ketosteroid isomerase-like protein
MSRLEENKALIAAFFKTAYEDRDYDRCGEFFAEDGVYEDAPLPPGTEGRGPKQVAERIRRGVGDLPALIDEVHRVVAEGDTVITEHTETWCFETGERVPLPVVSIHVIENGKIKLHRDFWDGPTLFSNMPAQWLEKLGQGGGAAGAGKDAT